MQLLESKSEVIDALGGLAAVAELTGRKYGAAAQWPHLPAFPANTYLVMMTALAARGKSAPPALWGMTEPRETDELQVSS